MIYTIGLYLMSLFYLFTGVMHFVKAGAFLKVMPPYLPAPEALNYVAGAAEILIAMGLLIGPTRPFAAWGAILLLIAVFPANWYMYQLGGAALGVPDWVLLMRLPMQALLIWWAWAYTRS